MLRWNIIAISCSLLAALAVASDSSTINNDAPMMHRRELIGLNQKNIAKRIHIGMLNGLKHFDIEAIEEVSNSATPRAVDGSSNNNSTLTRSTHPPSSNPYRTTTLHLRRLTNAIDGLTQINLKVVGDWLPSAIETMAVLGNDNTVVQLDIKTGSMMGLMSEHGTTKQISIQSNNNGNKQSRTVDGAQSDNSEGDDEEDGAYLQIRTVESHTDRKFNCGVDHSDEEHHDHHDHHHDHQAAPWKEEEEVGSMVVARPDVEDETGTIAVHRPRADRKLGGHNHHHHHHHEHEHTHHHSSSSTRRLRGTKQLNPNLMSHPQHAQQHAHTTPTTPTTTSRNLIGPNQEYTFQINILIAIDAPFIALHGDGSQTEAIKYVNFLITKANTIYEHEFGAHLHVVMVEEVDIFDETANVYRPGGTKHVTDLRDGLSVMRKYYMDKVGTTINGQEINLVHALLGKDIGGGIAFIDTVCDSSWGVGFSSGLKGSMTNLDDDAHRDAHMVAHEIGHSLGSGHSFDAYDPPVDTCGISCPSALPQDDSATLMSYCNFCSGGLDNVAMTFGGVWDGVGDKSDIASWVPSPQLASWSTVSYKPQRVSHLIWTTLESKGVCIQPRLATPPTKSPVTPSPSRYPTKAPTTTAPSSSPTTKSPNYFPEIPEDDGLIWVQPDEHCIQEVDAEGDAATTLSNECATAPGYMFDIKTSDYDSYGIHIQSLQFEHMSQNTTVDLYTTSGSYNGRKGQNATSDVSYRPPNQWKKVASISVNENESTERTTSSELITSSYTSIVLDTPITITPGSRQGFYLVAPNAANFFVVGKGSTPSSPDANGVSFGDDAAIIFDTFGGEVKGFSPTAQAGYVTADPPTSSPSTEAPTKSPTVSPTTSKPTRSPTLRPTTSSPTPLDRGPFTIGAEDCTEDCSAVAGYMYTMTNENMAKKQIKVTSVTVRHKKPKNSRTVELYCAAGSHEGIETDPTKWRKCGNAKLARRQDWDTTIELDNAIRVSHGESVAFHVKTHEEKVLIVKKNKRQKHETHDGKVGLFMGVSVTNEMLGSLEEGIEGNVQVEYEITKK